MNKELKKDYYKRGHMVVFEYAQSPEKNAARILLQAAVRSGKVKREPCEVCGNGKSDGHHSDYTKPLKVKWLCRKHHMEIHRKN